MAWGGAGWFCVTGPGLLGGAAQVEGYTGVSQTVPCGALGFLRGSQRRSKEMVDRRGFWVLQPPLKGSRPPFLSFTCSMCWCLM